MSYVDLLRDPRWQRKRLEVLERSNFTCDDCGSEERTLHVHHGHYFRGLKPWEYDLDELICLCDKCHHRHTKIRDEANWLVSMLFIIIGPEGALDELRRLIEPNLEKIENNELSD